MSDDTGSEQVERKAQELTLKVDASEARDAIDRARVLCDFWRDDWENAPRGSDQKFLVRKADGTVTTAYFYWYTEGGFEHPHPVACWVLQCDVTDSPLDEDGPLKDSGFFWTRMPPFGPRELTNFEKVGEFFTKFGLERADEKAPQIAPEDVFDFRYEFHAEENREFGIGHAERDLVKVADAIGDLLYVAYGTAHFYGIPIDRVFDAIHRKNMQKVRARDASESRRGTQLDVVKPLGWTGPEDDIAKILEDHAKDRRTSDAAEDPDHRAGADAGEPGEAAPQP